MIIIILLLILRYSPNSGHLHCMVMGEDTFDITAVEKNRYVRT